MNSRAIGNERLELVLATGDDVSKVLEVFSNESIRQEERTITIAVDGSVAHVKRILDALESNAIKVETFQLHKPTLDDVFLQLTGHEATQETEGGKK
jgi:ABC-2 type transport system ATP-binding protein